MSTSDAEQNVKCEIPLPPELSGWQWLLILINYPTFFACIIFIILLLEGVFDIAGNYSFYVASIVLLITIINHGLLRHKFIVHKARLIDRSKVEAYMSEARDIFKWENTEDDEDYNNRLQDEIIRIEKLNSCRWTEYQILHLTQLLIEGYEKEELVVTAYSSLNDLKEYAEDVAYAFEFDKQTYKDWKKRIEDSVENIREKKYDKDSTNRLRAETQNIQEYVTDYLKNWAQGSALLRGLIFYGVIVMIGASVIALTPVINMSGESQIGILNWGLLGLSGALAAVLREIRKSNYVEVGNTEGKSQMLRAILGSALGLLSGILLYAMIAGGLISSPIFPNLNYVQNGTMQYRDIFSSVFWAFAAGFSFETIFDRVGNKFNETS
jgi:hypothetical protein